MTAIEATHLYKVFAQGQAQPVVALDDVSLAVEQGTLVVIGGANGSGKSVLMSIIAGLMEPSGGTCVTASKPGLVFQDAATQILGDTPREDVAVGPRNQRVPKAEAAQIVTESLRRVRLEQKADYPALALSGGEKRRLAAAAVLAMRRDILIFDEPYANLDFPGVCDVNALIADLHADGKTVLLLTHEIEKCLGMADRFVVLYGGRITFDGLPGDALTRNLEAWGIRNPLARYQSLSDLVWRA